MNISIREREGVTILDIDGRIIGEDSLTLKQRIDAYLQKVGEGKARVLLNMDKVPMIDSSGLGIIVAAHTAVLRRSGKIALLKPSKNVANLITIAKLSNIITSFDDEERAIKALS